MTRILLTLLAIVEAVLGMFGLSTVANLAFTHSAEMLSAFLPVAAVAILLLVAGIAIVARRPWSYYAHLLITVVVGVLFALSIAPLLGLDATAAWLSAAVFVILLVGGFFLAPVRRYFGVQNGSAPAASS